MLPRVLTICASVLSSKTGIVLTLVGFVGFTTMGCDIVDVADTALDEDLVAVSGRYFYYDDNNTECGIAGLQVLGTIPSEGYLRTTFSNPRGAWTLSLVPRGNTLQILVIDPAARFHSNEVSFYVPLDAESTVQVGAQLLIPLFRRSCS